MKFTKQKNGYNVEEVDKYLSNKENEYANKIAEKDKEISELKVEISKIQSSSNSITLALTAAVEKAKEIEESSKNIYKLKIEQMTILYNKWETLLNEMLIKYPEIKAITNVREDVENLKNSIKNALKDDFNTEILNTNPATDPIRVLLDKLTGKKAEIAKRNKMEESFIPNETKPIKFERKTKVCGRDKTELNKLEEKAPNIKPIVDINLDENDKFESLVDKFLNSEEDVKTAVNYNSVVVPNESGFDLNECINPKEDLEMIMKSFDFFK